MKNIFTKQIWVENDAGWFGTYKWVNREWVEVIGSAIALIGIAALVWLWLLIL